MRKLQKKQFRSLIFECLESRRLLTGMSLASRVSSLVPPSSTAMAGSILGGRQGDAVDRMQSTDGRYVVFVSNSPNLVSSVTLPEGIQQVYRYDRVINEVLLVSIASDNATAGNGNSDYPTISGDGMRVAFRSESTNLSNLDHDNDPDIYVRDFGQSPATSLVSVNSSGTLKGNGYSYNPRMSENGNRVVFESRSNNIDPLDTDSISDIYVRDLVQSVTYLASVNSAGMVKGNNTSTSASISADGTRVAFLSYANNLVALDNDSAADIYVRELDDSPTTILVSVNGAGTQKGNGSSESPIISANGNRVVFESNASNFSPLDPDSGTDIYVRTLDGEPATTLVNVNASGTYKNNSDGWYFPSRKSVSADGTRIAFMILGSLDPLDQDQGWDIYVRDIGVNSTTFLASVNSTGTLKGNGSSQYPVLSGDGMRVAFTSYSTNLDPSDLNVDSDIYIRELDADPRTILASRNPQTSETSNRESSSLSISDNGEYVAFESLGSNLVPYDFNQVSDIFVYAVDESVTKVASRASPDRPSITPAGGAGFTAGLTSTDPYQHMLSEDGRFLVFVSSDPHLVSGIAVLEGIRQVYRYDYWTDRVELVSIGSNGLEGGNNHSDWPTISADGRRVAFRSLASNLHSLDTDSISDIFVRKWDAIPSTDLVSVSSDGTRKSDGVSSQGIVSSDGTRIAFASNGRNLDPRDTDTITDIYVRELIAPFRTILVSVNNEGNIKANANSSSPSINADGTLVAFVSSATNLHPLDNDALSDIYVRNLGNSPETTLASVNASGAVKGNFHSFSPTISANGRSVAFLSSANNLDPNDRDPNDDVYVRILQPVPTTILASGSGIFYMDSASVSISADGMRVAFATGNSLVPMDPYRNVDSDVYVRDLDGSNRILLVTVNGDGSEKADEGGIHPRISADGKRVVFSSTSNNLDARDTDRFFDIYVRELDVTPATYLASFNPNRLTKGNNHSSVAAISADGSRVAFVSLASNLFEGDWNQANDVFVSELPQSRWHNPINPFDVDNDGGVSALDVLALVDNINQYGVRILPSESPLGPNPPPYLDVDGDDYVSPLDILLVINFINSQISGKGEGEGIEWFQCIDRAIGSLSAESWLETAADSTKTRMQSRLKSLRHL